MWEGASLTSFCMALVHYVLLLDYRKGELFNITSTATYNPAHRVSSDLVQEIPLLRKKTYMLPPPRSHVSALKLGLMKHSGNVLTLLQSPIRASAVYWRNWNMLQYSIRSFYS